MIVTHDHRLDEDLLLRCLGRPARYLGMIGSRAKVHRFVDRLRARGVDLDTANHLRAPIGLAIGGREPGEIAVSVVAELVAVRRNRAADAIGSMSIAPASRPPGRPEDETQSPQAAQGSRVAKRIPQDERRGPEEEAPDAKRGGLPGV